MVKLKPVLQSQKPAAWFLKRRCDRLYAQRQWSFFIASGKLIAISRQSMMAAPKQERPFFLAGNMEL